VAIAFDAGFASLASFNRAFKLAEGKPPTEFRAERIASNEAATEAPGFDGCSKPGLRLGTEF
jgi:AraC-like DNA-binding protein